MRPMGGTTYSHFHHSTLILRRFYMLSAKLYFRRTKYENTSWGNSVVGSLEVNSYIWGTISRGINY